ncbi:MAG: hypothetical protein E7675_02690 [Ruminococcaceae bacterium]|nr:hypothetical protein [Oscillospiraceae bacterium]
MKKILVFFILFIMLFAFCSCTNINITGLNEFHQGICSLGTTLVLFPEDNFIEMYKHENGDFVYSENGNILSEGVLVKCLAYLQYSDEEYSDAKEYCLNNFEKMSDVCYEYNGFVSYEHHVDGKKAENISEGEYSPYRHCNIFMYNDEKKTLVFLGYDNALIDSFENPIKVKYQTPVFESFGDFIEFYYSEYYDF